MSNNYLQNIVTTRMCPMGKLRNLKDVTNICQTYACLSVRSQHCARLPSILGISACIENIGNTKNHQYLMVSRSWNFCDFPTLFAAPSRRSTIGVKIGQKSHLSEKFQGFSRAAWNDFHFQFCLHFNFPMQFFFLLSFQKSCYFVTLLLRMIFSL